MKKILLVLLVVIMVLSIVSIPVLAGSTDTDVSGRWCYGDLVEGEHKIAGGNEFYNLDDSGAWIGTIEGYSTDNGRIRIDRDGNTYLKTTASFESVEVDGKTGGLEIHAKGWLPANAPLSEYEGTWVITKATGELAGLEGRGTWEGVELDNEKCTAVDEKYFASVPYSGSIHFENE